jgi:hypothetical protein
VPAKLVVSSNKKKQLIVQLESATGKTLLSAGPFTDKRSVAGLRRTLKSVLSDSVAYEDQTPVVKRSAKVAAAAKPVNAVEAPIVEAPAAPAAKTRRPRKSTASK